MCKRTKDGTAFHGTATTPRSFRNRLRPATYNAIQQAHIRNIILTRKNRKKTKGECSPSIGTLSPSSLRRPPNPVRHTRNGES